MLQMAKESAFTHAIYIKTEVMKMYLTILMLLLIQYITFCQEDPFKYGQTMRTIIKAGVDLKTEPDLAGTSLLRLPFWTEVQTSWVRNRSEEDLLDTINGITGIWRLAKYSDTIGYLFDGFAVEVDSNVNRFKDYRIMLEGGACALPNYDPSLYWYGVYRNGSIDSLIRVEIEIDKRLNDELASFYITTNRSGDQYSLFLIGSSTPLTEQVSNHKVQIDKNFPFLYPGQIKEIGYRDGTKTSFRESNFDLYVTANVTGITPYGVAVMENYGLWLTNKHTLNLYSNEVGNIMNQDISNSFDKFGYELLPRLFWYGDQDNDLKPDLIFLTWYGTSGGRYTLFLSSNANEGEFLKMADSWRWGNCY